MIVYAISDAPRAECQRFELRDPAPLKGKGSDLPPVFSSPPSGRGLTRGAASKLISLREDRSVLLTDLPTWFGCYPCSSNPCGSQASDHVHCALRILGRHPPVAKGNQSQAVRPYCLGPVLGGTLRVPHRCLSAQAIHRGSKTETPCRVWTVTGSCLAACRGCEPNTARILSHSAISCNVGKGEHILCRMTNFRS